MSRIDRSTLCLLALFVLPTGCGESGSGDGQQAGSAAVPQETAPAEEVGRPAIPPEPPEAVEGMKLEPFFDLEATQATLAVAPGELFSVYICATHPNIDIKTAQWHMEVPPGVEVIGESNEFKEAASIGSYETVFITTFPCQTGDEPVALLKYVCVASVDFEGGEFRTVRAVSNATSDREPPFIGFVTCGAYPEMVRASGGAASITRKP